MLDRFTKTALVLLVIITAIILIIAYLGYIGDQGKMKGIGPIVEKHAASTVANVAPVSLVPAITDLVGKFWGFTIAGIVAGFIVGYLWTGLFRRREDA